MVRVTGWVLRLIKFKICMHLAVMNDQVDVIDILRYDLLTLIPLLFTMDQLTMDQLRKTASSFQR